MPKKSIDAVKEERAEKRAYIKNSENKKEKYIWRNVADIDLKEIQKEYPYIEKDKDGLYYIDRQGTRQKVVLPYIPVLDDETCLRILFAKPRGREQKPFPYLVIDNRPYITDTLINNEYGIPIKWRINPNKSPKEIKEGKRFKNYGIARTPRLLPKNVLKLTKNNPYTHKVIMALTFPKEMAGDYRKENDKETTAFHIDHTSNNEYDCRERNMSFLNRNSNWRGKHSTDNATLNDRLCFYRKQDSNGIPVYESQKVIFICMLGNYTKSEYKSLGDSNEIMEDKRKDGISQYNFIEYQGGRGNIICAMFSTLEDAESWYKTIKVKEKKKDYDQEEWARLQQMDEIEKRNWKIKESLQSYLNGQEIPGLEKMILLANTEETADGYIYFDNITDNKKHFLKARKRGLIVAEREEEHGSSKRKSYFVKDIANLQLSSDNIIDILYPYFEQIFKE